MIDFGIARAKYLEAPAYRTMHRTVLPRSLRARGGGPRVENIKWSEVSKRFGA
ncbi:MAG TPA: hypothetical protein VL181_10335 [Holophagaceae bacterium]|nr:hypothetical protein [Holophagaceae bacterium]